jgi:hypothetical protein
VSLKYPTSSASIDCMDLNEEIRRLTKFIRHLDLDDELDKGAFKDSTVLISRGDHTIILVGENADKYTAIVSSIYRAIVERRPVSKRAVSEIVADFFSRVLTSGDHRQNPALEEQLVSGIQELKSALFEKPKTWKVLLIVEGLAPSGLPLTVGQVHYQYYDDSAMSQLKDRVRDFTQTHNLQGAEAQMSKEAERFRQKAIAELSVSAVDSEAAIQGAKHKLQTTIDAINFFASREHMGGWAFLPGDASPQSELVITIPEDNTLLFNHRRAGPVRSIPLNQIANGKGFARVSNILSKDDPTELEERILASVQWAGRAQVEARREEAFLLYAIALESLLLGKSKKTEISHQLAVRCAHLGGGQLEDKRRVVGQIGSLYEVRSKIVHSGNFQISESELKLIRRYSRGALFIVIDTEPFRSMTEATDFERWFETQLLSGGLSPT